MTHRLQRNSDQIRVLSSTKNNGKNDSRREPDIAVPNGLLYFHYYDGLLGRNKSTITGKDNSIIPLSKTWGLSDWLHKDDNFAEFPFLTKPSDRSPSEDEGSRKLGPGDIVVQRATAHAWRNYSDQPCTMLFVLIVNYAKHAK